MIAAVALTIALAHAPTYNVQIIHGLVPGGDGEVFGSHITNSNISGSVSPTGNGEYVPMIYTTASGLFPIPLPSGAEFGYGHGSNNRNDVVGEYSDGTMNHAFFWSQATGTITLPSQGATAYALGINNSGEIVGRANIGPNQRARAVIFGASGPTALNPLAGYVNSGAIDVTNGGIVFGGSDGFTNTGYTHATYWTKKGLPVDMGVLPGFNNSNLYAANDNGDAVGYCAGGLTDNATPFLFTHGQMIEVPVPSTPAIAESINNGGDIVGTYVDPDIGQFGFAIIHGHFTLLNDLAGPDFFIDNGLSINDAGQIVATGFDMETFDSHLFLLTP